MAFRWGLFKTGMEAHKFGESGIFSAGRALVLELYWAPGYSLYKHTCTGDSDVALSPHSGLPAVLAAWVGQLRIPDAH